MNNMGLSEDLTSEEDQGSSLDSAISKIQSYIANPKLVTPQTLQDVLSDLMDLKDEETQQEEPENQDMMDKGV